MSSTISFQPYFPRELERLIFELAVSANGAKASTPLLLIAKRVREWIRPLIFRVITQLEWRWFTKSPNFNSCPQLLPSVGHFVQHVLADNLQSGESLRTLLSWCPNLQTLTVWGGSRTQPFLPILQEMPHLTRLTAGFRDLLYDELLIEPFSNLTHLGILVFNGDSWERHWKVLTHLPKLTHLSILYGIRLVVASELLRLCPLLKVMMITDLPDCDRDVLNMVDDDRFVMMERLIIANAVSEWEEGANGGVDQWFFCELIVLARRRKYFLTMLPTVVAGHFDWENNLNEDGKKWFSELTLNNPELGDLLPKTLCLCR